jgi:hypothetical protein
VLPALEGLVLGVDVALGQRDLLVGTGVTDGVDVIVDPDHRDVRSSQRETLCGPRSDVVETAEPMLGRHRG